MFEIRGSRSHFLGRIIETQIIKLTGKKLCNKKTYE